LAPAVGLVVKPWRDVSLYANSIEGLGQGPTAPIAAVNAGEVFAPIRTRQVEVGTKAVSSPVGVTLALFQITQPSGLTDPRARVFVVGGEQRNGGVELSVSGEPLAGVRVLASAAFIDAELTRTAGGAVDGKTAPGVPVTQLRAGAGYDLPPVPGLTVGGRVSYPSAQHADAANAQSIPGWAPLDLHARYRFEVNRTPLTARLSILNATNNTYWQSAGRVFLSTGAPLAAVFSLSAGF
jgi:iron complex outermembrane recepter protein